MTIKSHIYDPSRKKLITHRESAAQYDHLFTEVSPFINKLLFQLSTLNHRQFTGVEDGVSYFSLVERLRQAIAYIDSMSEFYDIEPPQVTLKQWGEHISDIDVHILYNTKHDKPFLVVQSSRQVGEYEPGAGFFVITEEPMTGFMMTMGRYKGVSEEGSPLAGYPSENELLAIFAESETPQLVLRDGLLFDDPAQIWIGHTTLRRDQLSLENLT